MDQNQPTQPTVDNDLQKAIDDITNTTNVDPVFSDPVAAPSSVPEGDTGELDEPNGPFPQPKMEVVAPTPETIAPLEAMNVPELNVPDITPPPAPEPAPAPAPVPAPEPIMGKPEIEPIPEPLNTRQIKAAALRDLIPLLDHINVDPTERFHLYRDIFEELKDYTILEPAYRAAREIPDEVERAQALLYLVESIDRM